MYYANLLFQLSLDSHGDIVNFLHDLFGGLGPGQQSLHTRQVNFHNLDIHIGIHPQSHTGGAVDGIDALNHGR